MARGKRVLVAATAVCLAGVPAPAWAQESTATGAGSLGAVDIMVNGQPSQADPIAPCRLGTTPANQTGPLTVGRSTRYGPGTTSCARNDDGTSAVQVSGQRFETTVLTRFGGPSIRARTFKASCATTANGSSGRVELGAVSGFTVPQTIPANYTTTVPGSTPGAPPMAEIIVNELIVPTPPDGSLTSNALHIRLFPRGGPASGDIVVGSASCAPYGD
jgi:hypothetical protein